MDFIGYEPGRISRMKNHNHRWKNKQPKEWREPESEKDLSIEFDKDFLDGDDVQPASDIEQILAAACEHAEMFVAAQCGKYVTISNMLFKALLNARDKCQMDAKTLDRVNEAIQRYEEFVANEIEDPKGGPFSG